MVSLQGGQDLYTNYSRASLSGLGFSAGSRRELQRRSPKEAWERWKTLTGTATSPIPVGTAELIAHYKALGDPEEAVKDQPDYQCVLTVFTARMARFSIKGFLSLVGPPVMASPFTAVELHTAFLKLNFTGAAGIDMITGDMFWGLCLVFLPFMLAFFQILLQRGLWPTLWAISSISVVPKKPKMK